MKHTILLFIKIGDLRWIQDLYENGTVYMNTLDYFKKINDNSLRGDPNEGAINLSNPKNATIRFSFMDQDIKPVSIRYGSFLKTGNLYCLYCVSSYDLPNPNDFKFDERNLEFGSHCLVIKQPEVFIEKMENELNRLGYNFNHNLVRYYQEQVQLKDLTPFNKPNAFEYQKEFRFFVENEVDKPIKLQIGNMKSYAEIYEAKDLVSLELKSKSSL